MLSTPTLDLQEYTHFEELLGLRQPMEAPHCSRAVTACLSQIKASSETKNDRVMLSLKTISGGLRSCVMEAVCNRADVASSVEHLGNTQTLPQMSSAEHSQ